MNAPELLNSPLFRQAVVKIQRRAEKQTDWSVVEKVFVRTDLIDRIGSPDSQLLLGRRGTGKTHLVQVYQHEILARGNVAVYIDCSRLGSGLAVRNADPHAVAQSYFAAFLNELGTELLDRVTALEMPDLGVQRKLESHLVVGLVPMMEPSASGAATFNHRQISSILEEVVRGVDADRFVLILDEWAQVPSDAQPVLAQYLKSAVLSVPSIVLKILAVNYQYRLAERRGNDLVGLELGADVPDVIDMDRYFVYDEQREFVADFFAQVLYNHLAVELGWDLDAAPERKRVAVERLFTRTQAFVELVRAAEGNCRDFLCIFAAAFFEGFRQSSAAASIGIPHVESAAAAFFDRVKSPTIHADPESWRTLQYISQTVLRNYKSRTFLVESSKAEHPRLMRLLNERVLHRLNGTYSHPGRPGVAHDLFTIDYGAFVRLRGTHNAVDESVFHESPTEGASPVDRDSLVPVDDKRSIRRIVFDPERLEVLDRRDVQGTLFDQ